MFGKILLTLATIIFPFVVLLFRDEPGKALIAMLLQCTILGWPVASIWALKIVAAQIAEEEEEEEEEDYEEEE